MQKAARALESARLLLDANDIDGACNRAYYAMFDAAQAALQWSADAPDGMTAAKTHSGLISAFSLHLVKSGLVPVEQGRALNRVAEIRLVADYTGRDVSHDTAAYAIEQAQTFVQLIDDELTPRA
jgi:uncharacterized protein (UPF0332 family)